MARRNLGIILNGATGGICSTQHLANVLGPIRAEGGLKIGNDVIVPKLLLLGRNEARLEEVARANGVDDWSTDLDAALGDEEYQIFFDAAATHLRLDLLKRALAAGKHIYTEKPVAPSVADGLALLKEAEASGLKHGAVEDKIYAPGYLKMASLVDDGFFGRIGGFRLEFGWWVFDGIEAPSQRPSWNYQKSGGGGLLSDMYPHWRYVLERMLGPIKHVVAATTTTLADRADEAGNAYTADVEDSAAVIVETEAGAIGTVVSSWTTRVRGEDLVRFQIDGTGGSAVAGMRRCYRQSANDTPLIKGFNLGTEDDAMTYHVDHTAAWHEVPAGAPYKNPYRYGWEQFLSHVVVDTPMVSDLRAGIRDVQMAEACQTSVITGAWVSMAPVT
ncbi:MAG: Gfo/Idh/MocA family oxidoreductase [Rhodospirillales bacterium]|nr:Gfo/Idh/MocA family oxidoreductase [Rhodospirillales bacterium]